MAILYGIGVGPGDSELLTIKAVKAIENSDVIVAPSAEEGGESIALIAAQEYIKEGTEIAVKHFPMGKKNRELKVNSLAPPMCPPAKLIVNLLFTSTTTIPGSLSFFTIKGVIALTAIPVELIKIIFLQVSNISCVAPFKEKSSHLLL